MFVLDCDQVQTESFIKIFKLLTSIILLHIKQIWFDFYYSQNKSSYSKAVFSKQNQTESHLQLQYQSISYFQSYLILIYLQQTAWSSENYNSYWKNKINQNNQASWSVFKAVNQSQLSAQKQSLMITADTAAATESWSSYFNFEWEINFHCDQDWYEWVTENWLQSFYFIWLYHIMKDFNFDDKNIYDINLD